MNRLTVTGNNASGVKEGWVENGFQSISAIHSEFLLYAYFLFSEMGAVRGIAMIVIDAATHLRHKLSNASCNGAILIQLKVLTRCLISF